MSFIENVRANTNTAYTANGAKSNETTLSYLLDFFSKSGALRGRKEELINYFSKAYDEDKLLAMKAAVYMRDVRGGQGERQSFRDVLEYLVKVDADVVRKNLDLVPEFGRWDDLFVLFGTKLENDMLDFVKAQINKDLKTLEGEDGAVSILAKWMPSINTSSAATRALAQKFVANWKTTPKLYRKRLSALRKRIDIVERRMSAGDWETIDFSRVPSYAIKRYSKAFRKHNEAGYAQFMEKVSKGEAKINSATLFPYDIVNNFLGYGRGRNVDEETLNAQWNALPNYAEDAENILAVVDTSGSMMSGMGSVPPINVAVSLGIYLVERIRGPFKDHFITFSEKPKVQKISGVTIADKVASVNSASWGYNTDLIAVFKVLLDTALQNKTSQEEMPAKIVIISDMQFDQACRSNKRTNFEQIDKMYAKAGYTRPDLVFWNCNASADNPVTKDETGTALVSGASPSIFKAVAGSTLEDFSPMNLMLEVLNSERYQKVQV
jgi:hypothetical protein